MLFNSQIFLLLFLPITLVGWYALGSTAAVRKAWLLLASLFFYAWWDWRLLPLLVGSILINRFLSGLFRPDRSGIPIVLAVVVNLGLLAIFKYADFLADSLAAILNTTHTSWSIILPLGISFFTFQQISYLVDRRRIDAPAYNYLDYALYVSFFPQLIAGPIVRHDELIPELQKDPHRPGVSERLGRGLVLFLIGLGKKVILADAMAGIANPVFAAANADAALSLVEAGAGALAFGLQIYFDFSAYSDMAIGLALMFGLTLPDNFNTPYAATSLQDFWRRWHMTLSRFLRDYLYIPLGGSRRGPSRQALALGATMLLGGLWHGAAWTFVAWGALHGIGLALGMAWRRMGGKLPTALGWVVTMVFVFLCWVPFRAESFEASLVVWGGLFGLNWISGEVALQSWVWILGGFVIAAIGPTARAVSSMAFLPRRSIAIAGGCALFGLALVLGGGANQEFIYFQF